MSNHVGIGPGGRFQCNHCGATHDPFKGRAVELWAITALGKEFTKQHAECPEPEHNLCKFCFARQHHSNEHVNATTKNPSDWWDCGDTGLSSQSIWRHMMGMPHDASLPLDPDDFGRCHRLLNAPWAASWKQRIGEMAQYGSEWENLVAQWPELERLYLEELPSGRAPKLYKLMGQLTGDDAS